MTDKQILQKLEEIETANPTRFKQYKLKDHLYWAPVAGTNKLTWNFHPQFLGNLERHVKVEVSKIMNKLTKTGYSNEETGKTGKKEKEEEVTE